LPDDAQEGFLRMLSAEQLSEIVASYSRTRTQPNRRAARVCHSGRTTIYRMARKPSEMALPVQMRDLSARGCSFTLTQQLPRDSQFILRFSRRGKPPVSILCTVMHCRPAGDGFRIGAEFTCQVHVGRAAKLAEQTGQERERIRRSILG
jgi:hypothetical protein